ncbi:PKD domain-containing protein [Chitinophaga arvensicola]|uniref:Por secretion system C-terminal sorting domain-containing protein n=1 Tax=Chitinophaga arvensicola TaxID=29529 RepID=A0A1I0R5F6_9BACT|nr:PKD domain-containing protein [Chitinophaga arvensicola]SEW35590.1 Por secretion system C-terminal sorting domain-containing protein [Chitinophaga arvensicola]
MNRLLLLFVLLISSYGLRATPFLTNKISTGEHPGDFKKADTTQCTERLELGPDIYLHSDGDVAFKAPGNWATYLWSNGATTASTVLATKGKYWLRVTDQCGNVFSDTLILREYEYCTRFRDNTVIGCDSTIHNLFFSECIPMVYKPGAFYPVSWHFSDGSVITGPTCTRVTKSDEVGNVMIYLHNPSTGEDIRYYKTIRNASISIAYFDKILVPLNKDTVLKTVFPDRESMRFDPAEPLMGKWSTGDTTQGLKVTQSGKYTYTLSIRRCPKRLEYVQYYAVGNAILNPIMKATSEGGLTYNFEDSVLNSYYPVLKWEFGDGETAEGREVTHTYAEPGYYSVKLTGVNGNIEDAEETGLEVGPNIKPDLGPDALLCPGDSLNLYSYNTVAGAKYHWNTGDTTYTLKVKQPGQYILEVVVGDRFSTDTINITAGCKLAAGFFYKRANDGKLTMVFTETPTHVTNAVTNRHWDFGDGNTSVTENPSHTYAAPGNYNVRLWIHDSIAHQQDSIVRSVYIMPPVKVALGKDTTIAAGQTLTLDASAAIGFWHGDATYRWSTGDTSRLLNINKPGFYTLTVKMYGYSSTDTIKVTWNPPPVEQNVTMLYSNNGANPKRVFFQNTSSLPDIIRTTWYTGDGNSVVLEGNNSNYVFYNYAQEGVYQVRMEVLTSDNLIHTAFEQVTVWPAFNAGSDTTYTGSPMLFKINEPFYSDTTAVVTWYPGGIKARQLLVTGPGEYSAYLNTPNFSAADTFYVYPPLHVDIGPDTTLTGNSLVLKINAPYFGDRSVKCTWYPGAISGQQITVQSPGTYTVSASRFGSVSVDSIVVKDGRPKPADFSYVRANNGQYTMNFSGIPSADILNATYSWDFGDNGFATGKNVAHTYNQAGVYNVWLFVTDSLQRTDTVRKLVTVVPFVSVNLGPDTTVEAGTPFRLDGITAIGGIRPDNITFQWSTGDTSSAITVTQPGSYGLSVSQYGRITTDSIRIYHRVTPPLKANFTYGRANNGQLTVNFAATPTPRAVKYSWNFGDNTSDSGVTVSHTYHAANSFIVRLTVSDNSNGRDTMQQTVTVAAPIRINLGPDTTYYGTPLVLRINAPYDKDSTVTVKWMPGNISGKQITVNAPGTYYATATQYGFSFTDTIVVASPPQVPPVIDSSAAVVTVKDSIPVTYTFPHPLNQDNIFTVQLIQSSSSTGGRSSAPEVININSFKGTDPRVSLNVKLPESVPCGKNYRIRVISSSPADTSIWSQGFEVLNPPPVPVLTQRGDSLESTEGFAYQWFRNNQPVNGATSRTIRAKVNGSYQVQVFSSGDCSTMSAPLSMVITGLTDLSLTISKLTVYPNPTAGAVYVEVEKVPAKPVQADVYNSKGGIVYTFLIKEKKTVLDLSTQPRGIYYIVPRGAGKQKAATVVIQ